MKKKHNRGIVVFTAPEDTVLNIFNYPEPIPVKKGDQVVFQVRFPSTSRLIFFGKPN